MKVYFIHHFMVLRMDLVSCPVGAVLEFLQELSAGLSPSTLKVYVAALAAYHVPLSGDSLGRHPFITHFLRGTLRLRKAVHTRVPTWDLTIVLEGLSLSLFKPIEEVSEKFITPKTIFLLAVSKELETFKHSLFLPRAWNSRLAWKSPSSILGQAMFLRSLLVPLLCY